MVDNSKSESAVTQGAVEPAFVVQVAFLALIIYAIFGGEPYGSYAVIVFFGCWRLSVANFGKRPAGEPDYQPGQRDEIPPSAKQLAAWGKAIKWRVLVAIVLLVLSFWVGSR